MEGTKEQNIVEDLMAEKQAILEELAQCKADKDFVWNLWRRLQSAQPDVTSVVSMVVAREKEKGEEKDKKVLEILQVKDEKIKELKERILAAEDESHYSKTRYHDLLIENEELKQKLDEIQSEFSAKEKELREENGYLTSLLTAHQAQKEVDDQAVKENLDKITEEKNQLKLRIVSLEKQVSDFSEQKLNMASAIEANATLEEKIRSLQNEVSELTLKSAEVAKNCEEAESKLNEKQNAVKEQLESLEEQSKKITELESDLVAVKSELEQAKESHKQAVSHITEQENVIKRLEELQAKNQRDAIDHEQEYRKGLASLQKSVADLQARCSVYQEKETKLLQEIEKLRESSAKLTEDVRVKELIIEELKDAVRGGVRSEEVSRREDRLHESSEHDHRMPQRDIKRTQDSYSRKGLKSKSAEQRPTDGSDESIEELRSEIAMTNQETERKLKKITALDELENRLSESRKLIDELKKLLELKEAELVETRRAHSQRQQRYRMLKENYQLVLEQIKTYEASNADRTGSGSQLPVRLEERELRHLDSDQVWKELAYYKHEYEALAKERHDVLEEVDVLRVQHANDLANVQELRVQISEEKEENSSLRSKMAAGEEAFDALRLEVEKHEDQLQSWQEKALQGQSLSSDLEEQNQFLRLEIKALQEKNQTLTEEFSGLADEFETLNRRYNELSNKAETSKVTEKQNVVGNKELASQTVNTDSEIVKQHVESLSSYDEQVRRIADRILRSPPKDAEEIRATQRIGVTQGTQTDDFPRFVDSSVNVNLDADEVLSTDEEDTIAFKSSVKKGKVPVRRQETPQPKKVAKKTPRRNEWASMKQRILSLTQEVSALRQSKDKAVKSLNLQRNDFESLQTEYNSLLSKLQLSRNSVQHLTDNLKMCERKNERLVAELKEQKEEDVRPTALSIAEWKRLEEELRLATMECIRLASIVRTLGGENEQLRARLKELQDNNSRLEHAVTQKKTLLDEMKTKMKLVEEKAKQDSDTAKNVEEKYYQLKEREKTNKLRIETLEHRLDGEMRDKQKFRQELMNCQEELKKKTQQLTRSQTLRNQAKLVVSEMEAAATKQLQGLANQSEATIASLQRKLDKAQERIEEFQALVRTLVEELLASTRAMRHKLDELHEKQWRETSRTAAKEARSKACSILNISSKDLENIMEESAAQKEEEARLMTEQENAWMAEVESALKRQGAFAVPLLEVLLDLVDERVAAEAKFAGS
ncbi:unnamed protein product [Porites evermanni]|uniref:Centlein n=1 Tax=Porites evermanni TaxID=104178 RepID=A0ABN8Q2M6_9CNID|nr:unnamed protein product [Porites evermanni]